MQSSMNNNTINTTTQEQMWEYVYRWLEKKYKDKAIPTFEVTPTTLSILYNLAQANERKERDCEILVQEYDQRAREYKAEAERLRQILDTAGIKTNKDPHSLLNSCVDTLAQLAVTLGISDTETSSYYIALNNLKSKMDKVTAQQEAEKHLSTEMLFKTQEVIQRLAKLRSVMEQLEEKAAAERHKDNIRESEISYFRTKREEYEQDIRDFKEKEEGQGTDQNNQFTHPALVAAAEQLTQLQELTAKLTEQLASYMDLPPDINLAKLKIEEARNKLQALEDRLSTQLNGIL